jgi:hypothetical protein
MIAALQPAELAWRAGLGVGDLFDAIDKQGKWYQACVVDTAPGPVAVPPIPPSGDAAADAAVAQAAAAGAALGSVLVQYLGCPAKNEEWLPRTSHRIARLNFWSGGRRGTSHDVKFEVDQERTVEGRVVPDVPAAAATFRPLTNAPIHKGRLYISLLNYFLGSGAPPFTVGQRAYFGMTELLGRMRAGGKLVTFGWVADITSMLGKAADVYTDDFGT